MEDAQAVGPDDAHLAFGDIADLLFEFPPFRPQLGEAGRDDDGGANAQRAAVGDDGGDGGGRRGDDGQVNDFRKRLEMGIAADAMDGGPFRIDRVDNAAEGVLQQVADEDAADGASRGTGSDDGDRLWMKD